MLELMKPRFLVQLRGCRPLKPIAGALVATLLLGSLAQSQTTPFAEPLLGSSTGSPQLSLGNLMALIQARHIKLLYAGQAKAWPLVEYELNHVAADLRDSAMLYRMIPVELVTATDGPLLAIQEAAKSGDMAKFHAGYTALTGACNSCHQAGGVGFIRIQTPTASPFTDQDLTGGK